MSKILESTEATKLYQTALSELRYYDGAIDGIAGRETKEADVHFAGPNASDNLRLVLLMRAARKLADAATGLLDACDQ